MRLIDVETETLIEAFGADIPEYSILSHTWGSEEVTFQDMHDQSDPSHRRFNKIMATCRQAKGDGIKYAWIDTCCIDKSSSAELTEAINSMFTYYTRASVCYVFLSDLDPSVNSEAGLSQCRWFTRGWTLQELIAPGEVRFYDSAWNFRGTKIDLLDAISRITHIRPDILQCTTSIEDQQQLRNWLRFMFAAEKLSWISHRQTKREEDMAYCLLGLFDIQMPLLYGEGDMAFKRLQEMILVKYGDLSVLAWKPRDGKHPVTTGVLARHPSEFEWIRESNINLLENTVPKECSPGSRGLCVNFRLCQYREHRSEEPTSPPYFRLVMDLGVWVELPVNSADAINPTLSLGLGNLISVASSKINYSRSRTVSLGIALRKFGPKLYCRDLSDRANCLIELNPFQRQPRCPEETAFLHTERTYPPLNYWESGAGGFSETAVHFPKQSDLEVVSAEIGTYWDPSRHVLLCWHDLSHISADWDIITVKPTLKDYDGPDILVLVGPLWFSYPTQVCVLGDDDEQKTYLLDHIRQMFGMDAMDILRPLHLNFNDSQSVTTGNGNWVVSCSTTHKVVDGISSYKVLCVELSLSSAQGLQ